MEVPILKRDIVNREINERVGFIISQERTRGMRIMDGRVYLRLILPKVADEILYIAANAFTRDEQVKVPNSILTLDSNSRAISIPFTVEHPQPRDAFTTDLLSLLDTYEDHDHIECIAAYRRRRMANMKPKLVSPSVLEEAKSDMELAEEYYEGLELHATGE